MKDFMTVIVFLAFIISCSSETSTQAPDFPTANNFTLEDVDENPVSLSDYSGKVIVINFFATWCAPCQEEMPKLDSNIWQIYKDRGVQVIGVDLEEDLGQVKLWQINHNLTFPLLIDTTGEVFRSYAGTTGNIPHNVIIDQNFKIRYSEEDYDQPEMIAVIEQLLQ